MREADPRRDIVGLCRCRIRVGGAGGGGGQQQGELRCENRKRKKKRRLRRGCREYRSGTGIFGRGDASRRLSAVLSVRSVSSPGCVGKRQELNELNFSVWLRWKALL